MTWVIAILLALILVALMASDKSAAGAVKSVLRFALLGAALLILAFAILLFFVWFHLEFAEEDWWQTGSALLIFFALVYWSWSLRKELAAEYKQDKRGVLVLVGKFMGIFALILFCSYAIKHTLESFHLSGWWLIAVGIAGSGVVLLARTAINAREWREIWLGPPAAPDPWSVVQEARWKAEEDEQALWDKETAGWDERTHDEKEAAYAARDERIGAIQAQLAEIEKEAEAAKARESSESGAGSVRGVFWLCVLFGTLGVIPLLWRYGFDWAMTWKIVKGREWLAGAIVIGAAIMILGAVASTVDEVDKFMKERRQKKDGVPTS
jgi:hypothetical protein